jgi:hypothetical protein
MLRLLLVLMFALLFQFPCRASEYIPASRPVEIADAGKQQTTEAMKQSDYKRRVKKKKEQREAERQVAAVGATTSESGALDTVVLVVLAVTAGMVLIFARRLRGRRRRPRPRGSSLR